MARFIPLHSDKDCEFIIDLDKIELIKKTATYCVLYIGGIDFEISLEEYEQVKSLL